MSVEEFELKMLLLGINKITSTYHCHTRGKQFGWKILNHKGKCRVIVRGFDLWEKLSLNYAGYSDRDLLAASPQTVFNEVIKYIELENQKKINRNK